MQKHPLLTVKEAAQLLRLDERSVRERLINGQLKGEKKSHGLREKWFVYKGAVDSALEKQQGFIGDPVGLEDVTVEAEYDEPFSEQTQPEEEERDDWIEINRDRVKVLAEEIVKPLMDKIETQTEVIYEQKRMLSEQERQLKLLPDLQKQSEQSQKDLELRHVENEALKKQIAALEAKLESAQKPWWKKVFGTPDV